MSDKEAHVPYTLADMGAVAFLFRRLGVPVTHEALFAWLPTSEYWKDIVKAGNELGARVGVLVVPEAILNPDINDMTCAGCGSKNPGPDWWLFGPGETTATSPAYCSQECRDKANA